ncbi:MAG: M14 family zinc carboxypeptidase, partial [Longimicrobiales bacterium]
MRVVSARSTRPSAVALLAPLALFASTVPSAVIAQTQPIDEEYTAKIAEATTEPFFITPHVDDLPASETVPTPLDVLGHIAGQPDVLSYPEDVHGYMRAVAEASDRVEVFSIGTSEEGREMIVVVVADEATITRLEDYKRMTGQLADPRTITDEEARQLFGEAKPIYYATGAIHSPETGSPEMLMELVYRLAVDESPFIREIRDNLIFMTTPIVEVDGRAKVVDLHMAPRKDPDADFDYPRRPLYWGKYVAHDNNRDGMGLQLELTNAVLETFLEYKPTVMHDLHESASYLYTSTGRGPYNAWIDPIVVEEWNRLAHKEVKDMTAFGVPGVYTHDFYDGWAPNYMFWIANMRNAIGRFYETQGSGNASTRVLELNVERQWHRMNPPLGEVLWNIRNNVNLQQSALLIALHEVATNRHEFLENFWLKSKRSIAKPRAEGPAAWVFPAEDPRPGQQARLLGLLQRHGVEVQRANEAFTIGEQAFGAGSYVVRMDQPYSRAADMLLDKQYYNPDDPSPYDDTGWTHGPLFNVETVRVDDAAVLDAPMTLETEPVKAPGGVQNAEGARAFIINY